MKRFALGLVLVALFSAGLFPSCRVVQSEKEYIIDTAGEGYRIYATTVDVFLSPLCLAAEMSLRADMYLSAETEEERALVASEYFPDKDLVVSGDTLNVLNSATGSLSVQVITDGLSLSRESGARWICRVENIEAEIANTGHYLWSVRLDPVLSLFGAGFMADYIDMEMRLKTEGGVPVLVDNAYHYYMTVSGSYTETSVYDGQKASARVGFETSDTTSVSFAYGRRNNPYLFDGGFSMHIETEGPVVRSEDMEAVLTGTMLNTTLILTYMGETTYWR